MQANPQFKTTDSEFWANVRSISQSVPYSVRGENRVKAATLSEMEEAMLKNNLSPNHLVNDGVPTPLGLKLEHYFAYRAEVLNTQVQHWLMDATEAESEYKKLAAKAPAAMQFAMNKQTGTKAKPAYFTAIIKMLATEALGGQPCDFDPQKLTTFTDGEKPIRTFARRVDGAFPRHVNPVAVWETKEYYYTTTFGSRIADGVYETMLDGMECMDLEGENKIFCHHTYLVDARDTWWSTAGRPYLCRIIDLLHMGLADEVIFGREALTRLPILVAEWVAILDALPYPGSAAPASLKPTP